MQISIHISKMNTQLLCYFIMLYISKSAGAIRVNEMNRTYRKEFSYDAQRNISMSSVVQQNEKY